MIGRQLSNPYAQFLQTSLSHREIRQTFFENPGVVSTIAVGVQITMCGFVAKSAKAPISSVKSSSKRSICSQFFRRPPTVSLVPKEMIAMCG